MEDLVKQIRQVVVNLGGEPVRADETVDEGVQHLQGYGRIGAERLNRELQTIPPMWDMGQPQVKEETGMAMGAPQQQPMHQKTQRGVSRSPVTGYNRGRWNRIGARILGPREEV